MNKPEKIPLTRFSSFPQTAEQAIEYVARYHSHSIDSYNDF